MTLRLLLALLFQVSIANSFLHHTPLFKLLITSQKNFQPFAVVTKQKPKIRLRLSKRDENDDEEDEDEDEDDYITDLNDSSVADFRDRMSALFGTGTNIGSDPIDEPDDTTFAPLPVQSEDATSANTDTDWAIPVSSVAEGVVLLANPSHFCTGFGDNKNSFWSLLRPTSPNPLLLSKFGLTLPPPAELGPDRRADLLPVLIVVEYATSPAATSKTVAILLNRRTGYLLGDLEQQSGNGSFLLEKFCIQPLWFGGIDPIHPGLDMLHQCPTVQNAKLITSDGLYWGGDPGQAQDAMAEQQIQDRKAFVDDGDDDDEDEDDEDEDEDVSSRQSQHPQTPVRPLTGFDFKFFVQSTVWKAGELERQIDDGVWFCAQVSKDVLFKSRDRMGTRRAKPLWTECMELLGGQYKKVRDQLYADENETTL